MRYAIPRMRVKFTWQDLWSVFVSTARGQVVRGPHLAAFERKLREWFETDQVVLLNSARGLFHVLFRSLAYEEGSEVILGAVNYHLIPKILIGLGLRPRVIDVNDDFTLSIEHLKRAVNERTRAVIVTNLFGLENDVAAVREALGDREVDLIVDSAHSFGPKTYRQYRGCADYFILSLSYTKTFHACGGGLLLFGDGASADRVRKALEDVTTPSAAKILSGIVKVMAISLATRPLPFTLSLFPGILLFRQLFNRDLIDDVLIREDETSPYRFSARSLLANLQARIGLNNLDDYMNTYGDESPGPTVPLIVEDPEKTLKQLLWRGIDCRTGFTQYCGEVDTDNACRLVDRLIFLPVDVPQEACGNIA